MLVNQTLVSTPNKRRTLKSRALQAKIFLFIFFGKAQVQPQTISWWLSAKRHIERLTVAVVQIVVSLPFCLDEILEVREVLALCRNLASSGVPLGICGKPYLMRRAVAAAITQYPSGNMSKRSSGAPTTFCPSSGVRFARPGPRAITPAAPAANVHEVISRTRTHSKPGLPKRTFRR